jgi:cystine transport system substrate-binding protein
MNCGIVLKVLSMTERLTSEVSRRHWLQVTLMSVLAAGALVTRAQATQSMRVGFIRRYQPYSFVNDVGQLEGFDVDVVQALLKTLDLTMISETDTLPRLQSMLAKGEIDFIGNQLLHTPENRRQFDFVTPYASIQLVVVQHESDDRDFFSLDDMLGRKLGVLAHSGVADQAQGALGKSVLAFYQIDHALKALAAKDLDVVLEENLIAEYHIEQARLPLKVGAPMAAPMRVGLAVSKGQKQMQEKLSMAVKTVLKDRTFRNISNKWFGYDVSRPRVSHASNS